MSDQPTDRKRPPPNARDAMIEAALKKITAPDLTISLRPSPAALVIADESAVPDVYWEPREPRLNRADLLADLKKGIDVPGVHLSNPEPILSVRVK